MNKSDIRFSVTVSVTWMGSQSFLWQWKVSQDSICDLMGSQSFLLHSKGVKKVCLWHTEGVIQIFLSHIRVSHELFCDNQRAKAYFTLTHLWQWKLSSKHEYDFEEGTNEKERGWGKVKWAKAKQDRIRYWKVDNRHFPMKTFDEKTFTIIINFLMKGSNVKKTNFIANLKLWVTFKVPQNKM